jgi:RNA polymerase sigma factor (sigma-70 family)
VRLHQWLLFEENEMSESDHLTDDLLLIRFQEGDEIAFETLYERHEDEIQSYARLHLLGSLAAQADDLCQQVWLEFCKDRQRFTPGTQVRALLYVIAQRRCRNIIRDAQGPRRDIRRNVPLDDSVSDETANPAVLEDRIDLRERLAKLPPNEAEALRLVRLEGHTAQSAADKLGITLDKMQWRIRQALRRLRGDLGPEAA